MRALFAVLVLGFLGCFASVRAEAQNFCAVSERGRESCSYYSADLCRSAVAGTGGFCVYRATPTAPRPSERAYPDIAGNFRQGFEEGQRRRYEQDQRALALERQRLENEALRRSIEPPSAIISESGSLARQAMLADLARPLLTASLTYERISSCEPQRAALNARRAFRRENGLAPLTFQEEAPYWACLHPYSEDLLPVPAVAPPFP